MPDGVTQSRPTGPLSSVAMDEMAQELAKQQSELEQLRSVKRAAKAQFSGIAGVSGFGIGDHTIRIYVTNLDVLRELPKEYKGVVVDYVLAQDVVAR